MFYFAEKNSFVNMFVDAEIMFIIIHIHNICIHIYIMQFQVTWALKLNEFTGK